MEVLLFWVAHLQFASSLAKQQLRGEHLVVGLTIHDRLELARCCSHERNDLLGELLDWRTGQLLSGRYELRDMTLGLFGIEIFFLEGLVAHRLVVAFTLTPMGILCRVVGHVPPFLGTSLSSYRPNELLAIGERG